MAGISILIPTRNEADNIDLLLQRLFAVELPEGLEREILFVDDSSTDETRERIRSWTKTHPVSLICRDNRGGLASAVVTGAAAVQHDTVVVMDADLSHPPESIPALVSPLLDGSVDLVVGSRYVDGGATPEWPISRRIASKLASIPARLFTDVNDPMAGFFATTRERLVNLRPDVPGFKICLELLAVGGDRLRVKEVPIIFSDRFEGFSKMNKTIILEYLKQVVQLSQYSVKGFTPSHLALLTVLGLVTDVLIFILGLRGGWGVVSAHLLAGFCSGLVLFGAASQLWRRAENNAEIGVARVLTAVIGLIACLSLQGASFRLIQQAVDLDPIAAFVPAALLMTIGYLVLLSVYVFSGISALAEGTRLRFAAFGVIFLFILIRFFYLGLPELMEQEAYYWNYAQHPDFSYLDHPPMVALLIWLGTALFGTVEFGVRAGAFCCWFVTAFYCYRLACRVCGRTAALGAVLLVGALPVYFGIGLLMTPDAPLHAAWAALLYYLYRVLIEDRGEAWLGVGLSLGLGMTAKYTIVLLGPGALLFMLIDGRARKWFFRSEPFGAALLALILFSPVLIWNMQHEWASFLFQGEQRMTGRTFFTTHRLFGYITLILTPAGVLGALVFLFKGNRWMNRCSELTGSVPVGRVNRAYLLLLLLILSPLLVFLMFSFSREVKLNWASPLWLAAMPFIGSTVMVSGRQVGDRFLNGVRKLWWVTIVLLLVCFSVAMHYVTLGIPGVYPPRGPFLIGWEGMAREIEDIVDKVGEETGKRPIVVGMNPYQISSGLAFYRTKIARYDKKSRRRRGVDETVGWHLFGWHSLMYKYWSDPKDFQGRDLLAVSSTDIRVEYPYYQNHIAGMNNIHQLEAKKDGKAVRTYYFRLLHGYRPLTD